MLTGDKVIILTRGLPGSGKSSFSKLISEGKYPVYSIDDFFTDESGHYHFDFRKNHLAYEECVKKVTDAAGNGTLRIIVDNTFTLDWEMEPYFKIASRFYYRIYVITVENYHGNKNIHGISDEQIEKMAAKYKVRLY